jgi:membrane protein
MNPDGTGDAASTPARQPVRRRIFTLRVIGGILVDAAQKWSQDNAPTLGAAIAFYTVFSMSPVLLTVLTIASAVFSETAVRDALFGEISGLVGIDAAQAIQSVLINAGQPQQGTIAKVAAPILFVLGATTVFVQIQSALNTIWHVPRAEHPSASVQPRALLRYLRWVFAYLRVRLVSFALVIGVGFLLIVSLVVNAAILGFADFIDDYVQNASGLAQFLWSMHFVVTMVILTFLFAAIFRTLPDVPIAWIDVWIGALVTAFLFNLGKYAIGLYLANAAVVSSYGAAGTMIVILLWVYYSAQVFLYGAEVTWLWRAARTGTA